MVLVLFEVIIKKDCMDDYLAMAGQLKEALARAKGFIRAERFSSLVDERKLLSLSVWQSEEAVAEWRNRQQHRESQARGHSSIFERYTITVASPVRSYTGDDRREAPEDSNA